MTMILSVVGLALLAIGLLLHIIGLSTLEWSVISLSYSESKKLVGLWKTFWKHASQDIEDTGNNNSAKMKACQAFAIIGMLLAILGLALGFIHCLFGIMGKSKNIKLSVGALAASILASKLEACKGFAIFGILFAVVGIIHFLFGIMGKSQNRMFSVCAVATGILARRATMVQSTTLILGFLGLGVTAVGLVLHVVGLATPEWSTINSQIVTNLISASGRTNPLLSGSRVTFGLWETCVASICVDLPSQLRNDKWEACRALSIMGMLFGAAGLGIAFIHVARSFFGSSQNKMLPLISVVASNLAFASIIICIIVWASNDMISSLLDFGYSFYLCIAGAIIIIIGSAISFISSRQLPVLR